MHRSRVSIAALALLLVVVTSSSAQAYVGPGAGLSAIGAVFALIIGLFVAILGFIWYPLKRLFRKRKAEPDDETRGK